MAGVLSHEGGDGEPAETKPSAAAGLHCGAAETPELAMLLFRKGTTLSWLVQKSSFRGELEVWDAVVQDMTLATTGLQDHGATALHFQHVEGQGHRPHISVEYLPGEHTVFALDFSPPESGSLLLTSLYFRQSQSNRVRILQHHLGRIIGLPYAYETSCGPELEPFEASFEFVSEEDDFQSPLNAQDAVVLGKLYGELDHDQEIEEACRAAGKTMRRVEQQVAAATFTGHVSAAGKTSKHMGFRGMCAS